MSRRGAIAQRPDAELTREERYTLSAEALRRGDRDRAVELLNQNKQDDAFMLLSMVGLNFAVGYREVATRI